MTSSHTPVYVWVIGTICALAVLLAPAAALAAEPSTVARRLAADPVFVEKGASPSLTAAEAGNVRARIAERAAGRIRVAVLRERDVKRAGTVNDYAQDVDRKLSNRGALLIVAGSERFVLTSYPDFNGAAAAVRRGVRETEGDPLDEQLVAIVDRLAENDPGAEQDLDAPGDPEIDIPGDGGPLVEVNTDGIARVFATIAAIVIGGAALIVGSVIVAGRRRRGRDHRRALAAARKELGLLAEEITALDLDTSMPNADAKALEAYHAGVTHYDEAQQKLAVGEPDLDVIGEAMASISHGRGHLAAAKAGFTATSPNPNPT